MKPLLDGAHWSIASRLLILALAPAILMLAIVNGALYWRALRDAEADVQERAQILSRAVAEGSRYGVISGNTTGIDQTVSGILAADPSVIRVEVLDATRRPVVDRTRVMPNSALLVFESPITFEPMNVDIFDTITRTESAAPLGYVRVTVSPKPIVQRRAQRWAIGNAVVLISALVAAALGLWLAKRLREPLARIMDMIRSVDAGRFEIAAQPDAPGELGELQRAIHAMAQGLRLTHERLDSEVQIRTVALETALGQLQTADAEKRRLIASSNALVEAERRRISLEIHDDLNAALVSIRMHAAGLASAVRGSGASDLAQTANRIVTLVDQTYDRARNIVRNLRPEILDALGLPGAAEETVRHFDEVSDSCRYSFERAGPMPLLDEATAIAAYRILQEALSNVSKHARASRCLVTLASHDAGQGVRLTVADDGVGFDLGASSEGLGLVGMRERLAVLGGTMNVTTAPGQGTTIEILIPVGDTPTPNA